MEKSVTDEPPAWVTRGKTIRQLIKELQSFDNQDLLVQISVDDGETHKPISLVIKSGHYCLLVNSEIAQDWSENSSSQPNGAASGG